MAVVSAPRPVELCDEEVVFLMDNPAASMRFMPARAFDAALRLSAAGAESTQRATGATGVAFKPVRFSGFDGEWVYDSSCVVPEDEASETSVPVPDPLSEKYSELFRSRRYGGGAARGAEGTEGKAEEGEQHEVHKCALLYLHGGAYHVGSTRTHRLVTAPMARRGVRFGLRILCINYRMAPIHKYPAAVEDAVEALAFLHGHFAPSRIAVMGDSAGGGLAFATCLRAFELGVPGPAALVALSPWTDLTISGSSIETNAGTDLMFSPHLTFWNRAFFGACQPCMAPANTMQGGWIRHQFTQVAMSYAGKRRTESTASPLLADVETLKRAMPPVHIIVSNSEVLLSDSIRMYDKLKRAGVPATIERYDNQPHVFPILNHRDGSPGARALDTSTEHIDQCLNHNNK